MKSVVADYRYRIFCMRIVPVTGSNVYLTTHVHDLVMGGHTYLSTSGYQFSGYSVTSDFSPSSIDIEGIVDVAGIGREALVSGAFDGARAYVFATSWRSPVEDEEQITAGFFGKTVLMDDRFQLSYTSLIDALNQTTTLTYTAPCPKTFLGQEYAGCMVPVAANTVTGTLTSVTSNYQFRDNTRTEPADTFGAGTIQFTSGLNLGLRPMEIATYLLDGTIYVREPFYYTPAPGDTYSMVRGCRKRIEDCKNRWNGAAFSNILNFGGDLWIPDGSTYAHVGRTD
jgi:uncharacterized phage protein (TIGR02218 family)